MTSPHPDDRLAPTSANGMAARGTRDRAAILQQFVDAFFSHYDGTVSGERDHGNGVLSVALPPALATHFGTDTLSLCARPTRDENIEVVVPGSRAFDQILAWSRGRGDGAWIPLVASVSIPTKLPDGAGPVDGEIPHAIKAVVHYDMEVAARAVFVGDERHEDLVLVYLPEHGEVRVTDTSAVQALLDAGLSDASSELKRPSKKLIRERLEATQSHLAAWAKQAALPREQRVIEVLAREVQRLTNYYGELMAEHQLDDEKRELLAADLDRRLAEEVAMHRLDVQIEPLAYAVIARPRVEFAYLLRKAGHELAASWFFDLSDGAVTSPTCEGCGQPALRAALCAAAGHLHVSCDDCADVCDACGLAVCSEHGLVRCHVGGEPLCSSCAPRCVGCGKPTRRRHLEADGSGLLCPTCLG